MTEAAKKVLDEALQLPDADRARVAAELLASLEATEPEIEQAWAREIERRAAEARQSEAGEEDWRTVLDRVEREVLLR